MTELETTISLVLGSWASTPLKQLHHRLVIAPRRAVGLVLMILSQALHFSAQAAPHKGPRSGWKLLLTFQDLIPLAHMIVFLCLLGRRQHDLIQVATVWILIIFMAFLLLMTRIPLAPGRLGLHRKVKLLEEDLTIGVLFSLVILHSTYIGYFCLQAFRDLPPVEWVAYLSILEPLICNECIHCI